MRRKRGPYAKSELRQQELGKAALTLVQKKGHRNVAISEVAELAEAAEQTVYYHFPTKERLFIAALQCHDDENIRKPGAEAGAIADMASRAEVGVHRDNIPQLYTELAGAATDPAHPANPYFQSRFSRSMRVISTDIARLQAEGRVPSQIDADAAARMLLAAWEGLQFQWLHGPRFDIRAQIEWQIRALLGPDALD